MLKAELETNPASSLQDKHPKTNIAVFPSRFFIAIFCMHCFVLHPLKEASGKSCHSLKLIGSVLYQSSYCGGGGILRINQVIS
eukprot:c6914_g1_i1 orf=324-572(+)